MQCRTVVTTAGGGMEEYCICGSKRSPLSSGLPTERDKDGASVACCRH